MFFIPVITACMGIGSTIGVAIATVAGTSVTTGSTIGTIAGAGTGIIASVAEAMDS